MLMLRRVSDLIDSGLGLRGEGNEGVVVWDYVLRGEGEGRAWGAFLFFFFFEGRVSELGYLPTYPRKCSNSYFLSRSACGYGIEK